MIPAEHGAQFRAQLGSALYRLLPFGGYAMPLSAAELAPPETAASAELLAVAAARG